MNNFLIIDALNETPTARVAAFDAEDKNFTFHEVPFSRPLPRRRILKEWPTEAVAIFGPKDAATFCEKFSLIRVAPQDPISKSELDSFISEAAWRMFDRNKLAAAKQITATSNDLILADIRIRDFRLDDKSLVLPIGETGKQMTAMAFQTFIRRSAFEKIVSALPLNTRLASAAEAGAVSASVIRRVSPDSRPFVFVLISKDTTYLYLSNEEKSGFYDCFNWGIDQAVNVFKEAFGVSKRTAEELFALFDKNGFSASARRMVEKNVFGEIAILAKGVKSGAANLKSKIIYVHGLPQGVISRHKTMAKIIPVSSGEEMLKYFGFRVSSETPLKFPVAAGLIEHYFSPADAEEESEAAERSVAGLLNYFAKRRMKWMMP